MMTDTVAFTEEKAENKPRVESPKMDEQSSQVSEGQESCPLSPASSCSTPPAVVTTSTTSTHEGLHLPRQNHVSQVILHGIPIVSLHIDGKERLCLAQISNTHLKNYSYNEIHNRRVALGITCVQCTPVQLEILRRAGAMPVSSRRCGMITKREAERLVKSFLEDNAPPKLPEDFSFDVQHDCGWGCRGFFEPSRYNSSRAKCIKCKYCNIYFSPNKFIFHFHRVPEAKYNHPDAANFNSWRRHLKLSEGASDDILFVWEDVKAMFNGGSRKRILSAATASTTTPHDSIVTKKAKLSSENPYLTKSYPAQYPSFGMYSPHNKQYPYTAVNNSYGYTQAQGKDSSTDPSKVISTTPWGSAQNNIAFPSYDLFWANTLALSRSGAIRNGYYSNMSKQILTDSFARSVGHSDKKTSKEDGVNENKSHNDRLSAFRPVGRTAHVQAGEQSGSERGESCASPIDEENEEIDVTYDTDDERIGGSDEDMMSKDYDVIKDDVSKVMPKASCESEQEKPREEETEKQSDYLDTIAESVEPNNNNGDKQLTPLNEADTQEKPMAESDQSDCEAEKELVQLTKEELFEQLRKEIESRKKTEKEVDILRETYSEQSNREKSYRDEMAHQLQVVRDTLTTELEQERKVRFALQQKLKEAHDALHNFSCKMLASRQCDECTYKDSPVPR